MEAQPAPGTKPGTPNRAAGARCGKGASLSLQDDRAALGETVQVGIHPDSDLTGDGPRPKAQAQTSSVPCAHLGRDGHPENRQSAWTHAASATTAAGMKAEAEAQWARAAPAQPQIRERERHWEGQSGKALALPTRACRLPLTKHAASGASGESTGPAGTR